MPRPFRLTYPLFLQMISNCDLQAANIYILTHLNIYLSKYKFMGTITISIDDEIEKRFRKTASSKYGTRKGYLGEAVTEAMKVWIKTESGNVKKAMELLEKGHNSGGLLYKSRDELHER